MLRLVHPVVIVVLLGSARRIKVSVRVRVRLTVVGGVEVILAVEDASALAGEGGHAQPAESAGQTGRFLLTKGSGPPFPPHPDPGKANLRCEDVCLEKQKFKSRKMYPER